MFRPTGLTLRAAPPKERDHLLDGAATPPFPRSIQSCPAGQRQNTQETAPSKAKDLSAQFLERGIRFKTLNFGNNQMRILSRAKARDYMYFSPPILRRFPVPKRSGHRSGAYR